MKKQLFLVSTILVVIASCKKAEEKSLLKDYSQLEKASGLLGRWENNSDEGNLSEIWTRENDSIFHGESYFVIKNDTVFGEKVVLSVNKEVLVFTVTTLNQNDQKPVAFTSTNVTDKQFTFENPAHDFPTKIDYRLITPDSLVAVISGLRNGKPETEQFTMKKVK